MNDYFVFVKIDTKVKPDVTVYSFSASSFSHAEILTLKAMADDNIRGSILQISIYS